MTDHMKHTETFHIDELSCKGKGTLQWFLDKCNSPNAATHPITTNNHLDVFICGEKGFASIAADIEKAEGSIDLCCWGFDPGMELVRAEGFWPRGPTFGDLLIAAGERGVRVRLLVWLQAELTAASMAAGAINPRNLPGWTHDTNYFNYSIDQSEIKDINAKRMLDKHREKLLKKKKARSANAGDISEVEQIAIAQEAREEYCSKWFRAARGNDGRFKNIFVASRDGKLVKVRDSLPSELSLDTVERAGMVLAASHHQKSILIDYLHHDGAKAVGYVMGLNSVTDYWDTEQHQIEDNRREHGGKREATECVQPLADDERGGQEKNIPAAEIEVGFSSFKPYRDYACRLQGGAALIAVRKNFEWAWFRATVPENHPSRQYIYNEIDREVTPTALLRPPQPGNATIQIVRTQPEEEDKTIKELYFQATDAAANTGGYVYVENQYFQYEEWSRRLVTQRKAQSALWKSAMKKTGQKLEDLPILHVFIVTPVAERAQMVPRTYDALAVVGQQGRMTGQNELIDKRNKIARLTGIRPTDVVQHANDIKKPTAELLERDGLRVVASMLQVSGSLKNSKGTRQMRYREIYIHSKLMLINDSFFTLGSANLNMRSMNSDSELNLATNDRTKAIKLRRQIWRQLSGGKFDGADGSPNELKSIFALWVRQAKDNRKLRTSGESMQGFLLPIEDNRSSTTRLG